METFEYNDYVGPETLQKEYKLFTFHFLGTNLDFTNEKYCEELINTGRWIFNKQVIDNLNYYIDYYLPKYTASFFNKMYLENYGEMYFGINNDGFIQGIPFKGELNEGEIQNRVSSVLKSNSLKVDGIQKSEIINSIKVEVIKINTKNFKLDDYHLKFIENYYNLKKDYNSKINIFKKRKKIWISLMTYYSDKLTFLLNNNKTRKLIIQYVKSYGPEYDNIISLLESEHKFSPIKSEEIPIEKKNKNTIWYWVTQWKDDITDYIMEFRPSPPIFTHRTYPINIIVTLVDMIPQWLDKDKINLYLIKFSFEKPKKDFQIKYKQDDDYYSIYRSLDFWDEPTCQTL